MPLRRRAGGAERAALDQRLDRLLVDRAASTRSQKSHSEVNGAALLARPLDRLDGLVADALDGVEAEADVAGSDDDVNSWSERLTSGGRISIPISSQRATKNGTLSLVDITEEISAAMYSAG